MFRSAVGSTTGSTTTCRFRVTMSHCKPGSIKTDASWKDIWHVMLEWVRQRAPLKNPIKKGSPGHAIMEKASGTGYTRSTPQESAPVDSAPTAQEDAEMADGGSETNGVKQLPAYLETKFEVNFDEKLGRDHDRGKYVRYQLAPRENWGPMARAK